MVMTRTHVSAAREIRREDRASPIRVIAVGEADASRKARTANAATEPSTEQFAVTFFHTHTLELMPLDTRLPVDAERVAHFLRCRVTSGEHEMAEALVPLASSMADHFHASRIDVISGYRSDKLNEMLRKKGHQVASDSQHTHGQALDFRIPGVNARVLAAEVAKVHVGGIGIYTENNFVHADTGRQRRWFGR